MYPAAAAWAGWAADAFSTTPMQHLRPGILRLEDLLMGAYKGWLWPPIDASIGGKGTWPGALKGLWGPEVGAKGWCGLVRPGPTLRPSRVPAPPQLGVVP